jgi:hypothetical protein
VTRACAVTCAMTLVVVVLLGGCSREKIDWKSAEAADTVEGYDRFVQRHPDSELATQARARVEQLNEDRDWKRASTTDTVDAYRQFLAQHESGKWAGEARIRIENFALDGTALGPSRPVGEEESAAAGAPAANARPPAAAPTAGSAEPKPGSFGPRADATPSASAQVAGANTAAGSGSTAKPASTPTAAAAPAQFGIQLGAFHSQEAALNSWKTLQAKYDSDLHGLFARAVPVQQSAGQLFRLQAPVGEESRARSICASLTRKSQPCVVVLPQPR